jgi:protein-arginine kinase activator protein McsA
MLCAKCQENEATFHLTTILHGREGETSHLCKSCGTEMTPPLAATPGKVEALPVVARKCEICGKEAFSVRVFAGGGSVCWCFDCAAEHRRTLAELFTCEQSEFMECIKTRSPHPTFTSDPQQLRTWLDEAAKRAVQILKERRQGNC